MFFAKSSTPSPSLCDASIGNFSRWFQRQEGNVILSEAKDLKVTLILGPQP
jgi:hypothetical protein